MKPKYEAMYTIDSKRLRAATIVITKLEENNYTQVAKYCYCFIGKKIQFDNAILFQSLL